MFADTDIRNFTDGEYLHYAALGHIPGIDNSGDDQLVVDCLSANILDIEDARRTLVEERQAHSTHLDRCIAVATCGGE